AGFVRTNMEVVAQELQAIPQAAMIFPLDCPCMTAHTRNIAPFILAMLPTPRFPQYLHVHAMADNSKGGRRPASNPFRAPYSTFLRPQGGPARGWGVWVNIFSWKEAAPQCRGRGRCPSWGAARRGRGFPPPPAGEVSGGGS